MQTIGVYDSGIGGLTVLKPILERFVGNNVYYYADNLNIPFGNTPERELLNIVTDGVERLLCNCDVAVVACNTASTLLRKHYPFISSGNLLALPNREQSPADKPILGLFPPLAAGGICQSRDACDTLLMATANTLSNVDIPKGMQTASVPALASMIEERATYSLDMRPLLPYLSARLSKFKGVKRAILGCSHYPFCKEEISAVLGGVQFTDGRSALIKALGNYVQGNDAYCSKVTFAFSGRDETAKYSAILRAMINGDAK